MLFRGLRVSQLTDRGLAVQVFRNPSLIKGNAYFVLYNYLLQILFLRCVCVWDPFRTRCGPWDRLFGFPFGDVRRARLLALLKPLGAGPLCPGPFGVFGFQGSRRSRRPGPTGRGAWAEARRNGWCVPLGTHCMPLPQGWPGHMFL